MWVSCSRLSLQMHRRFRSLEAGGGPFLNFWHCIFRFDLMTTVLAIHSTLGGFRFGKGTGNRELTFGFHLLINISDQFSVLSCGQTFFYVYQVILETGDGIALAPELEHLFGDVIRSVVDGVSFHTHHFGFDEG